jgi:hypothetical protein
MFRRSNRWHSRFDQPDPYDGSYDSTDPQSFNRYAYVQNDPVNFVDPTGLDDDFLNDEDHPEVISTNTTAGRLWGGTGNEGSTAQGPANPWADALPKRMWGHDNLDPQNPRPKKEPFLVKVVPKKNTPTCVEHEWGVFNRKVEAIKAAAEMHFEERELPWPLQWLQAIASGIGGGSSEGPAKSAEDRLKDSVPDIINIMARDKEIEEGTQQAAKLRDQRIKENCKKP